MAFLAAGILAATGFAGCSDTAGTGGEEEKAVPVETVSVGSRTFQETVRGIGTLEAVEAVEIRPEISGILKEARAEEGMEVKAGGLLFLLEDDRLLGRLEEQEQALEAAESRLENTLSSYRRLQSLWKRRAIAKDRWDRIQTERQVAGAEVKRLQAAVAVVRESLKDTRIRAPFSGVLSERLVDPGDLLQQGQPLIKLYRRSGMQAVIRVPGRHAGGVEPDRPANIQVDAYPERTFFGRVVFVSPDLDPSTREFQVKASVEDAEGLLKPGMFARVEIITARREGRPSVPEEALVPVRNGYAVFTVENGRARRRAVKTGLRRVGVVEIVKGLEPGDTVVRTGHLRLADGDPVRETEGQNVEGGSP